MLGWGAYAATPLLHLVEILFPLVVFRHVCRHQCLQCLLLELRYLAHHGRWHEVRKRRWDGESTLCQSHACIYHARAHTNTRKHTHVPWRRRRPPASHRCCLRAGERVWKTGMAGNDISCRRSPARKQHLGLPGGAAGAMRSSGTRDRAQIPHRRSDYHPRDITPAGCEQSWRAESQGKPSELVPTCRARSCPHILVPEYVHSCISIQCVRCTQCILTLSLNTQTHTRAPAMNVMPSGSEVCQLHRARCSPRVAASSKRSLRQ